MDQAKSKLARTKAHEEMRVALSLAVEEPFVDALLSEEWDDVRGWLYDHHRRLGDMEAAHNILRSPDAVFAPAAAIARMRLHLERSDVVSRAFQVVAGSSNPERDLVSSGDDLARPLARIRQQALRAENKSLLYLSYGGRDVGYSGVHGDTSRARRAARQAFEASHRSLADPDLEALVRVKVSAQLFGRLCAEHRDDEAFLGATCVIGEKPAEIREYPIRAQAVISATIDGRPTRIEYSTALGRSRSKDQSEAAEAVVLPLLDAHDLRGIYREEIPAEGPYPSAEATQLLGPERCRHSAATWTTTPVEARLRCDDCFEAAVIRVPAHRVPKGHPAYQELDEVDYLSEVDFWDAVHDRPPNDAATLAEMRARDGYDSMRISDHFPELARSRGRAISVSAAMNRR